MKTKVFLFILLIAFLMPSVAQAQVGSLLKKKLEQAVTSAKGSTENDAAKADSSQQDKPSKIKLPNLGIGKITAKYEDNYDFKGLIRMKTELYDKGKPEGVIDLDMWINAATESIGMETSTVTTEEGEPVKGTVIVDSQNKVMLTYAVMASGKSGMIMLLPDSVSDTGTGKEEDNVIVRKTGNKRTICGYPCDEYEVIEEKENTRSLVWTTDKIDFRGNRKMLGGQQGMPRSYGKLDGVTMATETYEKGVLAVKMEVTKIDLNETHSISTEGVSLMQMDMSKWGQKKK